jgi:ATP-dependent Clp protease ATP-binding subunit ClpX
VLPLGLVEPDGAVLGVLEVSLVPLPVLEGVLPLGVLPAALPEEVSELPGARGEVMSLPLRSRGSVSPLRPCAPCQGGATILGAVLAQAIRWVAEAGGHPGGGPRYNRGVPKDPRLSERSIPAPAGGGARRLTPPREEIRLLTPRQIFEHLDRFVIGQRAAKRAVATAAHQHLKRIEQRRLGKPSLLRKSNLLLIGPTGSGKTHIARKLAELLEVPFSVVDATEYTEAGYYGKDVEVMVAELLLKSGHSIDATERGIIFIDEIDKIARRNGSARTGAGSRDIGGEGVQQALLKLLEGREIFVPLNVTQHWNKHDFVQVDTSDILFICAGTFTDLHQVQIDKQVGFGSAGRRMGAARLRVKELIEYGMLAELLGRLPVQVQLEELTPDELYQILTAPPDALAREYREALALDGVELDFQESALRAVVEYAVDKKLGARALRGILEEVLADVMFEAPERRGEQVAIDRRYALSRLKRVDAAALRES